MPRSSEDIIDMLVDSNLKMASIVSGLLFACRSANRHNEHVNNELDRTYGEIVQYIEDVERAVARVGERRAEGDRT